MQNKILIAVLSVLGLLIGSAVFFGLLYVSFTNTANSYEITLKTKYENNMNVYDNGFKRVVEIAQVPKEQVKMMKDVYDSAIKGTFGPNGSQALFQAFQSLNINIDQSTFKKVQQEIETFRNSFQAAQTELLDVKRSYETFLYAKTSSRIFNMIAAYPRIDLDKYGKIVTSDKTEEVFKNKKDEPLKVF